VPYETRRQTAKRDPDRDETFGYANTQYYPDAYEQSAAIPVSITPGLQLRRFDIRLRRTRLVSLSGRTIETAGRGPLRSAEVELANSAGSGLQDDTYQRRHVDAQGAFRFELIRPGHYTLRVYRGAGLGSLPYSAPVDVGNAGIEDLPLAVPPFAQIRGAAKATDPKVPWEGELRVSLYGSPGISNVAVAVGGDGSFALENVPPGQWRLEFQGGGLHRAGDPHHRLHVAKVGFGAQDGWLGPVTVAESGNPPVEVTLSDEAGQLAGTVAMAEKDAPPMVVIRRTDGQPNIQQYILPRSANQDGAFLIPDLIPGEYEVGSWTVDDSGSFSANPQACGNRLVKVKITAGETSAVRLEICNR
jgi:hypothetical protein